MNSATLADAQLAKTSTKKNKYNYAFDPVTLWKIKRLERKRVVNVSEGTPSDFNSWGNSEASCDSITGIIRKPGDGNKSSSNKSERDSNEDN
jgi:hypothetical protein